MNAVAALRRRIETLVAAPSSEWLLTERQIREHRHDAETRNLLSRAVGRAKSRAFTGAPLTGFGDTL